MFETTFAIKGIRHCMMHKLFLIWLTFISDFVYFIHNQTNMYATYVLSPHIWHRSTSLQWDIECVFPLNELRVVSGSYLKHCSKIIKIRWINSELIGKHGTAFSHFREGPKVHFFPKSPFVNLKSKKMTPQYEILVAKLFFTWHRDWMVVAWREESLHITYPPYCFPLWWQSLHKMNQY